MTSPPAHYSVLPQLNRIDDTRGAVLDSCTVVAGGSATGQTWHALKSCGRDSSHRDVRATVFPPKRHRHYSVRVTLENTSL